MINEQSAAQSAAILSFTPAALDKLVEVMAEQDASDSYLRISASATPQGGVEYAFGLEDEVGDDDTSIEGGSVKALVDEGSISLITGSSIDYVEGFQRSGFVISNPNFAGGCACGGGGCGCGG
ncbi:MAG: iron-sulfur cluster assembly accessory protein [Chloroflexi bacterium]|nr:iron-sulfur cluster assembly accessory protein [Chloroflexota bacterium]